MVSISQISCTPLCSNNDLKFHWCFFGGIICVQLSLVTVMYVRRKEKLEMRNVNDCNERTYMPACCNGIVLCSWLHRAW